MSAPEQLALQRLAGRTASRVPVSAQEASWIYDQATIQAAGRRLDARIDPGKQEDPALVVAVLQPCLGIGERLQCSCRPVQTDQRAGQPPPGPRDDDGGVGGGTSQVGALLRPGLCHRKGRTSFNVRLPLASDVRETGSSDGPSCTLGAGWRSFLKRSRKVQSHGLCDLVCV